MMRKSWTSLALGVALLATLAAHAEQGEHRAMPYRRGGDERMLPTQRQDPPVSQQMPRESQHQGRMSPEERRQLRRDIDAAGRELYRPPHSQQRH